MKKTVTIILLMFVAMSVGFLIYRETDGGERAEVKSVDNIAPAVQVEDATPPAEDTDAGLEASADSEPENIESSPAAPASAETRKTIAYYFYAQPRCVSCQKIEAYTEEAIRTGFDAELGSGALEWRLVDIKEKGNEHFIQDYQLYSKSVVLVNMEGDKQVAWKNLEEVWNLLNDKQGFMDYIQGETRAFLEGNV